ncbi:MAG: hypothetical protein WC878_05740 [Candidatus Paceibacterota bacterium]
MKATLTEKAMGSPKMTATNLLTVKDSVIAKHSVKVTAIAKQRD